MLSWVVKIVTQTENTFCHQRTDYFIFHNYSCFPLQTLDSSQSFQKHPYLWMTVCGGGLKT